MRKSPWQGLVAVIAALVVLTACSPDPEEDAMPTPQPSTTQSVSAPNPAETITELVAGADAILFGTVESVDPAVTDADGADFPAQTAVVRVSDSLKGDAAATITVTKPAGTAYYLTEQTEFSYDARHEGIFVLTAAGDEGYELLGYLGVHDDWGDWQKFERVLAGLPEAAPAATAEELAAWTDQADIVVFASARGDEDDIVLHTSRADYAASATLSPIEVLKGEMPEPLDVVQGPQPDVVGGTWAFPVTDKGQTGVFFIDLSSGTPTVINTVNPTSISTNRVPLG